MSIPALKTGLGGLRWSRLRLGVEHEAAVFGHRGDPVAPLGNLCNPSTTSSLRRRRHSQEARNIFHYDRGTRCPPHCRPDPSRRASASPAGHRRTNTIVCMLLWRFRVADVLRSAAIGLGYVAAVLTHRKWRPGVWLFKLATGLLVVERRIRPDLEGAILSQYLRRPEKPRAHEPAAPARLASASPSSPPYASPSGRDESIGRMLTRRYRLSNAREISGGDRGRRGREGARSGYFNHILIHVEIAIQGIDTRYYENGR